eukprot:1689618-Rhodomonas_salina.2
MLLRVCYAMPGTEIGDAGTRCSTCSFAKRSIPLRYAMYSTDEAYGITSLYAMSSTELAYGATRPFIAAAKKLSSETGERDVTAGRGT